jgi:glutaminyl-peptide cyclotransferase
MNSWSGANLVVGEIWRTAAEMKVTAFENEQGPQVSDDHIALQRVHIPAVDIIDFSYPHWHKLSDTPDKCSPETMENLSKVLTIWLQRCR